MPDERKEIVLVTLDGMRQAVEAISLEAKILPELAAMPQQYQDGYQDCLDMVLGLISKSTEAIKEL